RRFGLRAVRPDRLIPVPRARRQAVRVDSTPARMPGASDGAARQAVGGVWAPRGRRRVEPARPLPDRLLPLDRGWGVRPVSHAARESGCRAGAPLRAPGLGAWRGAARVRSRGDAGPPFW